MWVVWLQHIALCPPVVSSQWPETWAMGQPLIINKIGFLINLSRTRNRWFLSVNAVIKKHSFASRVVSAWVSLVSGQWSLLIRLSSAGGNIVSRNRFTLHQSHKHVSDTWSTSTQILSWWYASTTPAWWSQIQNFYDTKTSFNDGSIEDLVWRLLVLMTLTSAGHTTSKYLWNYLINSTLCLAANFPLDVLLCGDRVRIFNLFAHRALWQVAKRKQSQAMIVITWEFLQQPKMKTWPFWTCFNLPQILNLEIKIIHLINTQLPVSI